MPTEKLHLAARRGFFDALVLRHVVIFNPAISVEAEHYEVVKGKTSEIMIEHARALLGYSQHLTSHSDVRKIRLCNRRDEAVLDCIAKKIVVFNKTRGLQIN